MKKKYLLGLMCCLTLMFGCSRQESTSKFNPPTWIQGAWITESGIQDGQFVFRSGFKFAEDDIYLILFTALLDYGVSNDPSSKELVNSSSSYSFQFTINEQLSTTVCSPVGTEQIECTSNEQTTTYTKSAEY